MELQPVNHNKAATTTSGYSKDQIDLIKRMVCKGGTNDELAIFLHTCQKTGLDPLTRQIYAVKRGGQMTIQTGIDGYRTVAARTGAYAGNDDPIYDNEKMPRKATVTVYKVVGGVRCPFTATARWDQYYPGDKQGMFWKKMPHLMLGKCAEALALRKAFPAELSAVYTDAEMQQADKETLNTPTLQEAKEAAFKTFGDNTTAKTIEEPDVLELKDNPPIELYEEDEFQELIPVKPSVKVKDPEHQDNRIITEKQGRRLFAITKDNGQWDKEQMKEYLHKRYGIYNSSQLQRWQYDDLCTMLEQGVSAVEAMKTFK